MHSHNKKLHCKIHEDRTQGHVGRELHAAQCSWIIKFKQRKVKIYLESGNDPGKGELVVAYKVI